MKSNVIQEKSFQFAVRIVKLTKEIQERHREFVLSKQLLRSGTNPGAMAREAEHAQSRADFINKYSIALKEANETRYWLDLLKETNYITEEDYSSIIIDCNEIIRIVASIVKTTKNR